MAEHSQAKAPRHESDPHRQGEHIMDTHESDHHIVPVSLYIKVILLLMVLLIITLGAAMVDFSKISPVLAPMNIIIAMTIAVVKAVLIILYFMHVRFSSKLVWVFAGAAFYWVVILFVLTLTDYMSRHMTNYPGQYTW
jgi:cytochrome c oxidase subunit 4